MSAAGDCDHWAKTPRTCLALIIIFDQLPRVIYRGDARAYAYDHLAQCLCLQGLELKYDTQLKLTERMFFYLPLEHSEEIAKQNLSVGCFLSLIDHFPEEVRSTHDFLSDAREHASIIERFGRFPYRNQILNRVNTAGETRWLKGDEATSFGQ